MTISAEGLLALAECNAEAVELAGVGQVRVRGLSFGETQRLGSTDDNGERAAILLHLGLVEPALSLEQARQFVADVPATVSAPLLNLLLERSGLVEGAQKSG